MNKKYVIRDDIWGDPDLIAVAGKAKNRSFCVAYVTKTCARLFQSGDVLVCDASRKAVSCGETDPKTLLCLHEKGVKVYSCPALHAKCAVLDDYVLIGSANMSESSSSCLVEIAVLQKDAQLSREVEAFIYKWVLNVEPMSAKKLKRLGKFWCKSRSPWQKAITKQRKTQKVRGKACHVETIAIDVDLPSCITKERIEKSEHDARSALKNGEFKKRKRELHCYWTSETWSDRHPKEGDDMISVERLPCKNGWKASVYGPATVVLVDKVKEYHIVHYLRPSSHIPFSIFTSRFNKGKSVMNRHCINHEKFERMVDFIAGKVRDK